MCNTRSAIIPFALAFSCLGAVLFWPAVRIAWAQSFSLKEDERTITVLQDGAVVLVYNKMSPEPPEGIAEHYRRSGFLHPVRSPKGKTVTATFPADHPHQHGVFSAWVKTEFDDQRIDFWNLAGGTGRVIHERVVSRRVESKSAVLEIDLLHQALVPQPTNVLRERWKITVRPTNGEYFCFDIDSTQTLVADKPLNVQKHHYGGMAFRGPMLWLTKKDPYVAKNSPITLASNGFLNDRGSDRVDGNHQKAKWVALSGLLDHGDATVAVLCHADNLRAPQAARLHPSKPYFCYAPCVEDGFVIDASHPLRARYRYLVTDGKPDPKWLESQWRVWCENGGE